MEYIGIILYIITFILPYSKSLIDLPIILDNNSHNPILFKKSTAETIIYLPNKKLILNINTGIIASSYSFRCNYDRLISWDENNNENLITFAYSKRVYVIKVLNDDDSQNNGMYYDYSNIINLNEEKSINVFFTSSTGMKIYLVTSYSPKIIKYYTSNGQTLQNITFKACDRSIEWVVCERYSDNFIFCAFICEKINVKGTMINFQLNFSYSNINFSIIEQSIGINLFYKFTTTSHCIASITENNNIELMFYQFDDYFSFSSPVVSQKGDTMRILEDCSSNIKDFYMTEFPSSPIELIGCCLKRNIIKCIRINKSLTTINSFQIETEGEKSYLQILGITYNQFIIAYEKNNKSVEAHIMKIPMLKSLKSTMSFFIHQENIIHVLSLFHRYTSVDHYILFTSLPSSLSGQFFYNEELIETNKKYLINDDNEFIFKTYSLKGTDIFKYLIYNLETYSSSEGEVTIKIKECYKSCSECDKEETTETHNCITCAEEHYFSPEDPKSCFMISEKKDNWYFDYHNNKFLICDEACVKCTKGKDTESTNCEPKSCSENYAYLEDDETNCILKSSTINYYLLQGNYFAKCYETCKTCFVYTYYCDRCIPGTVKGNAIPNCRYPEDLRNDGYYISGNYFEKCHERCKTCNNGLDSENDIHNCITCNDNYYLVNGTSNCYTETEGLNKGYFLRPNPKDNNNLYFYNCYDNCQSCNDIYDEDNDIQNCITCKTNYYFLVGSSNCYDNTFIDNGYYLDDNYFFPCFSSCSLCYGQGNDDNHNCQNCNEDYYFKDGTKNCYQINYKEQGYYLSNNIFYPCNNYCKTCSSEEKSNSQNCLTCKIIDSEQFYLIENVNNCSTIPNANAIGFYYDSSTNLLKKCHFSCKTCLGEPIENDDLSQENLNCDICQNNYYKIINTNNCHNSSVIDLGYNLKNNFWEKCDLLCSRCIILNDEFICIHCIENYYLKKGTSQCYNNSTIDKGYYLNPSTKLYEPCNKACETCNGELSTNCIICNNRNNYYYIEGELNSTCYNESSLPSKSFFLNDNKYSKCYSLCETCSTYGSKFTHNCISCKNQSLILYNSNCIENCPKGHYKYNNNCYENCPEGTYIYEFINECVNECPSMTKINPINNNCVVNSIQSNDTDSIIDKIDDNIRAYVSSDSLIQGEDITIQVYELHDSENIQLIANEARISTIDIKECYQYLKDYYHIPENEDIIMIKVDKSLENYPVNEVIFSLYDYQGNKLDSTLCENIDIEKPIVNPELLDLITAEDLSKEGIDVFNSNDSFFNSLCKPFTSNNGTDVPLKDRRNDFYQNVSFCEVDCVYDHIDYTKMTVVCNCDPEEEIDSINNSKPLSLNNIKNAFTSKLFNWNYRVVKCYNLVFNWKIMKKNYGCWVMLVIICLTIIFSIVYFRKGLNPIRTFLILFEPKNNKIRYTTSCNDIDNNFNTNNNLNSKSNPPKKRQLQFSNNNFINNNNKKFYNNYIIKDVLEDEKDENQIEFEKYDIMINNDDDKIDHELDFDIQKKFDSLHYEYDIGNKDQYFESKTNLGSTNELRKSINKSSNRIISPINVNMKSNISDIDDSTKKNGDENKLDLNGNKLYFHLKQSSYSSSTTNSLNQIYKYSKKDNYFKKMKKKNSKINNNNKEKNENNDDNNNNDNKEKLKDRELNHMKYGNAILFDYRGFLKIYWDFLKEKQIIINTFFLENHLELRAIKIILFFFSFGLEYTLNAFFYNDDYVSNAYKRNGVVDFISDLPKSVYSFLVSLFITFALGILSNSKDKLEKVLTNEKNIEDYRILSQKILRNLKIKLLFFFSITYILELIFWYYTSAFCAVYQNNQKLLLLSAIESFILTLIIPFFICFLLTIFRILALRFHLKILYYISKIIDFFF